MITRGRPAATFASAIAIRSIKRQCNALSWNVKGKHRSSSARNENKILIMSCGKSPGLIVQEESELSELGGWTLQRKGEERGARNNLGGSGWEARWLRGLRRVRRCYECPHVQECPDTKCITLHYSRKSESAFHPVPCAQFESGAVHGNRLHNWGYEDTLLQESPHLLILCSRRVWYTYSKSFRSRALCLSPLRVVCVKQTKTRVWGCYALLSTN